MLLIIIILTQPNESWDYTRQSGCIVTQIDNTETGEKSAQAQEAKEAQQPLYQKKKVFFLLDVVQMDLHL